MAAEATIATGRRKTAIARVRLLPGNGSVVINDRTFEEYFPSDVLRMKVMRPLVLLEKQKSFNVSCTVGGGGISAQAGAMAHGITRALLKLDTAGRTTLKKDGLITRDPRMKERKKYGQKGARKRFQFSKR